jgi:hypothetical protein
MRRSFFEKSKTAWEKSAGVIDLEASMEIPSISWLCGTGKKKKKIKSGFFSSSGGLILGHLSLSMIIWSLLVIP